MNLKELHGLPQRGSVNNRSHATGNINGHWKKNPTAITPGSSRTLASQLQNPFDLHSRRTQNPTASRTILDHDERPKKRMRKSLHKGSESELRESRYFSGTKRSEELDDLDTSKSSPAASSSTVPSTLARFAVNSSKEQEIINVDGDVFSGGKGKGKGKASPPTSQAHSDIDDIDIRTNDSKNPFFGKGRRRSGHEEQSRLPNIMTSLRSSAGPSSAKNKVEDGSSTARLRKKLESSYQSDPIEDDGTDFIIFASSSKDDAKKKSESSIAFNSAQDSPVENEESSLLELETPSPKRRKIQWDSFSEAGKVRVPDNRVGNHGGANWFRQSKLDSTQDQRSGASSLRNGTIRPGTVKTLASHFNINTRPTKHIDLKTHKMKTKDGSKPNLVKRYNLATTSRTKFEDSLTNSVVRIYQWGNLISEEKGEGGESVWLVIDAKEDQLQLRKGSTLRLARPIKSLSTSQLRGCKLLVGLVSENGEGGSFVAITCQNNPSLPDDIRHAGLTFFFNVPRNDQSTLTRQLADITGSKPDFMTMDAVLFKEQLLQAKIRASTFTTGLHEDSTDTFAQSTNGKQLEMDAGVSVSRPSVIPKPKIKDSTVVTGETKAEVRRSSRLSTGEKEKPEGLTNSDEIILVYPPSGAGAVNLTTSDLKRLEPSEFLNDTIIEFALKFWLNGLRKTHPGRAEEIHVFSSFFYKKLNNRKSMAEGYKSVRKWTAKVDLFKKKYIVVPINENFHWYLAIICRPELMLKKVQPESFTRDSSYDVRVQEPAFIATEEMSPEQSADDQELKRLSESCKIDLEKEDDDAVEEVIQITRDCSIVDSSRKDDTSRLSPSPLGSEDGYEDEDSTASSGRGKLEGGGPRYRTILESDSDEIDELVEDEGVPSRGFSLSQSSQGNADEPSHEPDNSMTHANPNDSIIVAKRRVDAEEQDVHETDNILENTTEDEVAINRLISSRAEDGQDNSDAVSSTSFYGTTTVKRRTYPTKGKQVVRSSETIDGTESASSLNADKEEVDLSKTWIFGFDSLGSNHPAALRRLNTYLRDEAADKKGVKDPDNASVKMAIPLYQPNFCDCGLYLLHFATTFLSDPDRYTKVAASKKKYNKEEIEEIWHGDKVKHLREELKTQIQSEAEEWRKSKPFPDKLGERAQSSDSSGDEIQVSEITRRVSSAHTPNNKRISKARETVQSSRASRLRG